MIMNSSKIFLEALMSHHQAREHQISQRNSLIPNRKNQASSADSEGLKPHIIIENKRQNS